MQENFLFIFPAKRKKKFFFTLEMPSPPFNMRISQGGKYKPKKLAFHRMKLTKKKKVKEETENTVIK